MKGKCLPCWGLGQNCSIIACYLQLTDVIKDGKRKKLFFSSSGFLFSFSSLSKQIFETVLTMNKII